MAKILVYNNDTLYAKRHTNWKDKMETFCMTANIVTTGGVYNG